MPVKKKKGKAKARSKKQVQRLSVRKPKAPPANISAGIDDGDVHKETSADIEEPGSGPGDVVSE